VDPQITHHPFSHLQVRYIDVQVRAKRTSNGAVLAADAAILRGFIA
jgi:hypothetical protein